jgi:hypothetical protein
VIQGDARGALSALRNLAARDGLREAIREGAEKFRERASEEAATVRGSAAEFVWFDRLTAPDVAKSTARAVDRFGKVGPEGGHRAYDAGGRLLAGSQEPTDVIEPADHWKARALKAEARIKLADTLAGAAQDLSDSADRWTWEAANGERMAHFDWDHVSYLRAALADYQRGWVPRARTTGQAPSGAPPPLQDLLGDCAAKCSAGNMRGTADRFFAAAKEFEAPAK